jgi:hypothetical protein
VTRGLVVSKVRMLAGSGLGSEVSDRLLRSRGKMLAGISGIEGRPERLEIRTKEEAEDGSVDSVVDDVEFDAGEGSRPAGATGALPGNTDGFSWGRSGASG